MANETTNEPAGRETTEAGERDVVEPEAVDARDAAQASASEEERGARGAAGTPGDSSGALAFARRHPAWTLIGAAGVSLFGGVEVAAGVLLGAGVIAMLRPKRGANEAAARDVRDVRGVRGVRGERGEDAAHGEPEPEHETMREVLSEAKRRMRAMARAALGETPT